VIQLPDQSWLRNREEKTSGRCPGVKKGCKEAASLQEKHTDRLVFCRKFRDEKRTGPEHPQSIQELRTWGLKF